jgi:2-methylisocitrate lyase-like PEP mutase family enzyme
MHRAAAFVEAGADVIFVEAPERLKDIARIPAEISAPVLINVVEGGRTPVLPREDLEAMGFRIALYANTVLRVALAGAADALDILRRTGQTEELMDRMLTWDGRQNLVDLDSWLALNTSIGDAADAISARISERSRPAPDGPVGGD